MLAHVEAYIDFEADEIAEVTQKVFTDLKDESQMMIN